MMSLLVRDSPLPQNFNRNKESKMEEHVDETEQVAPESVEDRRARLDRLAADVLVAR